MERELDAAGADGVFLSMAHDGGFAMAYVVLERRHGLG